MESRPGGAVAVGGYLLAAADTPVGADLIVGTGGIKAKWDNRPSWNNRANRRAPGTTSPLGTNRSMAK